MKTSIKTEIGEAYRLTPERVDTLIRVLTGEFSLAEIARILGLSLDRVPNVGTISRLRKDLGANGK